MMRWKTLLVTWVASWMLVVSVGVAQETVRIQTKPVVADDRAAVLKLLEDQRQAWNRGDIEVFMEGYWHNEEMSFAGGGSLVRGWQATLERYKKNYPAGNMGTLEFRNLEVRLIGDRAAMVLGNFHLTQGEKVSEGGFTLVLEKFDEGWRIIHDHSSAKEESEKKDD